LRADVSIQRCPGARLGAAPSNLASTDALKAAGHISRKVAA
jgi:hypothetical protein